MSLVSPPNLSERHSCERHPGRRKGTQARPSRARPRPPVARWSSPTNASSRRSAAALTPVSTPFKSVKGFAGTEVSMSAPPPPLLSSIDLRPAAAATLPLSVLGESRRPAAIPTPTRPPTRTTPSELAFLGVSVLGPSSVATLSSAPPALACGDADGDSSSQNLFRYSLAHCSCARKRACSSGGTCCCTYASTSQSCGNACHSLAIAHTGA